MAIFISGIPLQIEAFSADSKTTPEAFFPKTSEGLFASYPFVP